MLHKMLTVKLEDGVRAKPAALLAETASQFASQLLIEKGNKKVNAKSIMGIMSLGLMQGDSFHLTANGTDEKKAVDAIEKLIESNVAQD